MSFPLPFLFYLLGTIFFTLFIFLLVFFVYVSLKTYFTLKKRVKEFTEAKFLYSTFQKGLENPGKILAPFLGFILALFLKLKHKKRSN